MTQQQSNAQALQYIKTLHSDIQELAWGKLITEGATLYNDYLRILVGPKGSDSPYIEMNDHSKVRGQEVTIPKVGAHRTRGVTGDSQREGNEGHMVSSSIRVKVDYFWDGMGITNPGKNFSVIGSSWDQDAAAFLQRNHGLRKIDDMEHELLRRATERNVYRPNSVSDRDSLSSMDVFSTDTITLGDDVMSSLAAKPMKLSKDGNGNEIPSFLYVGDQQQIASYKNSSAYLEGITHSANAGYQNPLFTGFIMPWDGHPVYRRRLEDPSTLMPAGSSLTPRAFLGWDIPVGNTAVTVYGGGIVSEVTVNAGVASGNYEEVAFFQHFSNAPYAMVHDGTDKNEKPIVSSYVSCKSATEAITKVRYACAKNLVDSDDGTIKAGTLFFFSYVLNDGNKLVMLERLGATAAGAQKTTLTGSEIEWDGGTIGGNNINLAMGATKGALIVEVNRRGVAFGKMLVLGKGAGYFARGGLVGEGDSKLGAYGRRTKSTDTDHGRKNAIGYEAVFGVRADERLDKIPGNFAIIECALPLPGFPQIV